MSINAFPCGHPRSPENTSAGVARYCKTCRVAQIAARLAPLHARNREIVRRYEAGESPRALAEDVGISMHQVRKVLRKAGHYRHRRNDENSAAILQAAAEAAGANVEQLTSWWRAPKQLVHARWAAMTVLHQRGHSAKQIGRLLNRDHSTVIYGLRQAQSADRYVPGWSQMIAAVQAA